jgi:hypothetical protein
MNTHSGSDLYQSFPDEDTEQNLTLEEPLIKGLAEADQKERKLQELREQREKKEEDKKKAAAKPKGKDFYVRKVSKFLVCSVLLNLAIEQVFVTAFIFDYINGYMDNDTSMFGGKMQGNNFCFIVFYSMRWVGYVVTNCFIHIIQEDVEKFYAGRNGAQDFHL